MRPQTWNRSSGYTFFRFAAHISQHCMPIIIAHAHGSHCGCNSATSATTMDDNSADDRDLLLLIAAAAAAQPKEAVSEVVERNGKEENGTPPPRMRVSQQEDRHEVLLVPEDAPAGVKSFVSSAAPIAPMSRSVAVPQAHKVHQEDRDERELRPPSRAETEAMCRRSVPSKMSLRDFEKLGLLGMGGAAIVYLVRHRASRVVYAMKVQHISSSNPADRQVCDAPFYTSLGCFWEPLSHSSLQSKINIGVDPASVQGAADSPNA